jgi:hypothetical protein
MFASSTLNLIGRRAADARKARELFPRGIDNAISLLYQHHRGGRDPRWCGSSPLGAMMKFVEMYAGIKATTGLAMALLAFGCGAAESSDEGQPGETRAALLGQFCNGTVTTKCWTDTGSHQAAALDDYNGFRWYVKATNAANLTSVVNWYGQNGEWPAGYLDNSGVLPSPVTSVAVNISTGVGYVYALSEDGVVHRSSGSPGAALLRSPNGVDFGHWSVFIQPLDKSGSALSLKQIVSLRLPTNSQQGILLLALDFAGRIYVQDALASGEKRWMPAAQHPGFSGLPTSVFWVEISRSAGGGAYLLSSPNGGSAIYRAATGFITQGGSVSWDPVVKLPPVVIATPGHRTPALPTHVGGRYVITDYRDRQCSIGVGCPGDNFRFVRFDTASNSWQLMAVGVSYIPSTTKDLKNAPFNVQIWDTGTGFAVEVPNTHVDTYHL